MSERSDARTSFLQKQHTIKNIRKDFHEWHLGRARYAIWAIDVDTADIRQQVFAAQQHLTDLLLENYCRQPHITLCVCGFLSDAVNLDDDFGVAKLEAQISNLRQLNIKSFDLEIDALASFSSAPFFHIHDPSNSLCALHHCLNSAIQHKQSEAYIPHVTIGLYADTWLTEKVSIRLDAFEQGAVSHCSINRISLMCYQSSEIGGALTTIADYHFANGEMQWYEAMPFTVESFF